jgi:hypothetical protein
MTDATEVRHPSVEPERIFGPAIQKDGLLYTDAIPASHYSVSERMKREGIAEPLNGEQGFYTSLGRFVGRREARNIAEAAGQIVNPITSGKLFSEELWVRDFHGHRESMDGNHVHPCPNCFEKRSCNETCTVEGDGTQWVGGHVECCPPAAATTPRQVYANCNGRQCGNLAAVDELEAQIATLEERLVLAELRASENEARYLQHCGNEARTQQKLNAAIDQLRELERIIFARHDPLVRWEADLPKMLRLQQEKLPS